jgi:glutathione S-transferase
MIDFYALTSPNVQKVFIMLEECGLPYNIKPVDVWAGEQFTPEFATINPLLKVPAIVDSDGPAGKPYTVIESGAILIYLAEKTGKFIPHEPVARYETLQWVILQVANLGPMSGQHVHFSSSPAPATTTAPTVSHAGAQAVRCLRTAADSAAIRHWQRLHHRRYRGVAVATQFRIARHRPWPISDREKVGGQDRGA